MLAFTLQELSNVTFCKIILSVFSRVIFGRWNTSHFALIAVHIYIMIIFSRVSVNTITHNGQPFHAHCCHMGTAIKHFVPDQVKPSFVIFDIQASALLLVWHAPLGVRSAKRRHQSPEWTILSHSYRLIQ